MRRCGRAKRKRALTAGLPLPPISQDWKRRSPRQALGSPSVGAAPLETPRWHGMGMEATAFMANFKVSSFGH